MSQRLVYGVRFKKASRVFEFDGTDLSLSHGDLVIVEVEKGLGMGTVVNGPREPVRPGRKIRKVIRKADTTDVERFNFNTERETEAFRICKQKIAKYKLPMKLVCVENLFDSSKAIFYFTSDTRVDFRGLVKDLASIFHTRIEMRQIGVRDEAKMIGGLGPCGRAFCCASFLSDFEPVTIKMAKDQNLALNPVKISGVCGRLMCCLSYEHEAYKKGGSAHGCHKGGHKGGGSKHCGAHGRSSEPKPQTGSESCSQPSQEKQERGNKNRPERQGRNRSGRSRQGRARSGGAPEGGKATGADSKPAGEQSRSKGSEGGNQSNRPDRPDRNRQGRDRQGRERSGGSSSGEGGNSQGNKRDK